MTNYLEMWTVYDHPRDYPQWFVVRKFVILPSGPQATQEGMLFSTLAEVRRCMEARGLVCLMRDEADEPQIVEVWL